MKDWEIWWIAEAAYYKWLDAGCPESRDTEFWLAAEQDFYAYLASLGEEGQNVS